MLEVVAAGAVSDYGEAELASLRISIAAAASVDASDVSVTIAPGSVILTARIAVPSAAAATLTAESLASQLDSSASASTLLNIAVEETPAVRATTEVVVHPAPSPPSPRPLPPSPSWWVDGAPPGWLSASVAEPADTLQYADSWQFTSTDATVGVHPLGALSYDLPLAPFDASQGDLHSVHMLFTAVVTFEGLLGDAGGGSGGAASGECAFSYGDGASSHTSHAFYGTGAGSGDGGGPNQMDLWDFDVRGELLLTAGMESAVLGLSSASYADAGAQQCDAELCRAESLGMTQVGMCGPVCAGDAADRLTQLTWRPTTTEGDWPVPTMFQYDIDSGSFVYVNVTLQVDVSVTFRYRATPPLSPFAPPPRAPPPPTPPLPSVPSPSLRPPTALAPSTPGVAAPSPFPPLPPSPPPYPGTPAFQEETGTEADMTAQSSGVLSTGAIVGIVSALAAVLLLGLCIALIATGKMRVFAVGRIEMGRVGMKRREEQLQFGRLGPPAKTSEIAVLAVGEGEGEASPPGQPSTVSQRDTTVEVEVKEEYT